MTVFATLINGKAIATALRREIAAKVSDHLVRGHRPGLAVVLVGDDPASAVYVRAKARQTTEVGMASFEHRLPADVASSTLLALIAQLNRDPAVHGILVQLPLPPQIGEEAILRAIDPAKDVDGFHPVNVELLASGAGGIAPCTPSGAIMLLKSVRADLSGQNAVVIGSSNIVGKPMAHLLLQENCTVTMAHFRTSDLPEIVQRADIVVAAVGKPEFVRGPWIKPGALVIDVGINRIPDTERTYRLVGDVAFDEAVINAGAITPVPGGVGPMAIACLLRNTLDTFGRCLVV